MSKSAKQAIVAAVLLLIVVVAVFLVKRFVAPGAARPAAATAHAAPSTPSPVAEAPAKTAVSAESTQTTAAAGEDKLSKTLEATPDLQYPSVSYLGANRKVAAEEILLKEREMWAKFGGLTGTLDVAITSPANNMDVHFQVAITMGPLEITPDKPRGEPRWYCKMVAKDPNGQWTYTSDSLGKYQTDCKDPKLAEMMPAMLGDVFHQTVLVPPIVLLLVDTGDGASRGRGMPKDEYFKMLQPAVHPDFADAADSFVFKAPGGGDSIDNVVFQNGHLESIRRGAWGKEDVRISYSGYGASGEGGPWFPKTVSLQKPGLEIKYTFSNVKLNGAPAGGQ